MSRASRIPYHQNVYDLLQVEPGESPEAARMIAEHEATHGPLPASVREWYSVPNVVPLRTPEDTETSEFAEGTIWHDYLPHDTGTRYAVHPLTDILWEFARREERQYPSWVQVAATCGYYTWTWSVELDGSDDPPVWMTGDPLDRAAEPPKRHSASFSEFISGQFAEFYRDYFCEGYVNRHSGSPSIHQNGLWLRTPAEPFVPAVIDYLTELLGEPKRTPRPGNVTTYTFRPDGGTIRVTADEPGLGGALSAWWVHAETPERLAELARLVLPFGTLRDTLRGDSETAREVLRQLAGERS